MTKTKRSPRLKWDGDATTDGRYVIGRMIDTSGNTVYYLSESPLYIVVEGIEHDDGTIEPIEVVDEVPLPCRTLAEARRQAQAVDDGTVDEFEAKRRAARKVSDGNPR